ncbi:MULTISPECIES: anti-sigma factor domain-containing protein [unclassified Massilia]|uniref:anti-sigma factor n=1 Tax=unclassified Massilia TaxID=2609279 RepID=UPI0017845D39|nr:MULTISPECIES: anti-sigma factor [unclassified Massilia]MBD8531832.1 anti-sigma factor [Massilia sp. CFBP 13647]MBD8675277.1 anti-sigma factor [Massilia sp. CFBP 13721]
MSHADDNTDDMNDLAGEYVLGTLALAERRRVEQALAIDAALRAAVQAWEARLQPLSSLAEPAEPSPQLWARVEASLAAVRKPAPAALPSAQRWWDSLNFWRSLAAAGFAAAAMVAVVPRLQAPGPAPAPRYMVVLAAPGNMAPGWIVQADARGELKLVPLGTTQVPADRSLQFWTKADGWKGPVSLGLVQPAQTAAVSLAKLPPLQPNQLFEITLEPKSGSPIGRPTGPILYIGRAVQML